MEFCTIKMVDYRYTDSLGVSLFLHFFSTQYTISFSLSWLLLFLNGRILLHSHQLWSYLLKSLRKTASVSPIPLLSAFKLKEIRLLHKFDSRLFCVNLRSTRGSLKPVLWPTSTWTVLFKVRIHVSIHRLCESSEKAT